MKLKRNISIWTIIGIEKDLKSFNTYINVYYIPIKDNVIEDKRGYNIT